MVTYKAGDYISLIAFRNGVLPLWVFVLWQRRTSPFHYNQHWSEEGSLD
jgi:hypothetical protein